MSIEVHVKIHIHRRIVTVLKKYLYYVCSCDSDE